MTQKQLLAKRISIPKAVAAAAYRGLSLRKEYGRGGTEVGEDTAIKLSYNPTVPLSKVLHIAKYFPRHAGDRLDQKKPPSNGWIAWLLWGGDPGRRWAEKWVGWYKRELEKG